MEEHTKTESPISDKEKLKKLVSSEDLEQLMEVVGIKSWVALTASFAIILITLVWSVLGSIPIKISGNGQSQTEKGPYVVSAGINGTVQQVFVSPGQMIKADALIATLTNSTLALNIQLKETEIRNAKTDLEMFKLTVAAENAARRQSLEKQIDTASLTIAATDSRLPFLEEDLQSKIRLKNKGVLAPRDVEEARDALQKACLDIQSAQSQIVALQAEHSKTYRQEEIVAKESGLTGLEDELQRLELQKTRLEIRSKEAGRVIEVLVAPGDPINSAATVASIELPLKKGESLQFLACFGAQYGDLLDTGLKTEIEVAGVDPKLYGYLLGTIKFISPYPVTTDELMTEIKNKEVVEFLKDDNKVVYMATIELEKDATTLSGYRWSGKKGPPWSISPGTTATVVTIVEEKPPIVYVLPEQLTPKLYQLISQE